MCVRDCVTAALDTTSLLDYSAGHYSPWGRISDSKQYRGRNDLVGLSVSQSVSQPVGTWARATIGEHGKVPQASVHALASKGGADGRSMTMLGTA